MKFTVKENIPASDIKKYLPPQFVGVFGFSVMFYGMRNNYLNSKRRITKARERSTHELIFMHQALLLRLQQIHQQAQRCLRHIFPRY